MRPTSVFGLALLLPACLVDVARYEARRDALTDADGDGVTPAAGDCDDADPATFPGQPDGCDGVDRDCDRTVDEDADRAWSPDLDGDGFGAAVGAVLACDGPAGWVEDATDCDDADPTRAPDATEACNAVDDDCDGVVDDGLPLSAWYPDGDGDGFGTPDASVLACVAPEGYAAAATDCDDAAPGVNPDAAEVCGDGLDGDCDGTALGCGWDGPVSLGDTSRFAGGTAGEAAGVGLATGDVDGDGRDDALVGTDGNVAYVLAGDATRVAEGFLGLQARAEIHAAALGATFRFGRAVTLCDFDAEGGADLVIGGQDPEGVSLVLVFDDAATGRLDENDARYALAGTGDDLGAAVACGRVDENAYADLVIGAPALAVRGTPDTGAIHVVSGPAGGTRGGWAEDGYEPPRATVSGDAPAQRLGSALAVADVDGDGLADVLAGAPDDADGGTGAGAAWLLYGPIRDGAAAGDLGVKLLGAPGGHAGPVAAGDLDGDGYADVVVGAPADAEGGTAAGAVALVLGGTRVGSGATRSLADAEGRLFGHLPGLRFGESVAVVGGRFGDGAALAVGAPGADDGGTDAGALTLWDGGALRGVTGTADAAPATFLGVSPGDAAGTAVSAGDLDGDGWLDLLVGAPGRDDAGGGAGAAYVAWGAGL